MRLQTRLVDLGYLLDRSSGIWSDTALESAATFSEFNPGNTDYYAANAQLAPVSASEAFVPVEWPLHPYAQGMLVAYPTVHDHLTVGGTYAVIDCRTGSILNVRVLALSDTCATVVGAAEWDRATLGADVFPKDAQYAPVVVTIAGIGTAAVLQNTLRTPDTSSQEDLQLPYYLYFSEGAPSVGGLTDCRVTELLKYAAE